MKNTHGGYAQLKPATLLKVTLRHGCFSRFLNCTNGTKSRKKHHKFRKKDVQFKYFFRQNYEIVSEGYLEPCQTSKMAPY